MPAAARCKQEECRRFGAALRRRQTARDALAAPALEAVLAALLGGAEGLDEAALTLGDEDGLAVAAAEGEIGRLLALQRNLPLDSTIGLHQRDGALEDARDIETAGDVGAQAVDGVGLEGFDEFCAGELVTADGVGPDFAPAGCPDIERLAVRAEVDAVGGAHRARRGHHLPLHRAVRRFGDAPDVAFPALP